MEDPFSLFGASAPGADPTFGVAPGDMIPDEPAEEFDPFASFGEPEKVELPGLTDELLNEIYGGDTPEFYTEDDVVAAAIAYVAGRIEAEGSCILRGWPNWLYHSLPYISSTLLKGYAKNPRTCKTPYEAKDDANVGSGIHALSLQGQAGLDAECVVLPIEAEGDSKKAVAIRSGYQAKYPGKVLLPYRYGTGKAADKPYVMDVLRGVDASFREHKVIAPLLANSEKELTLIWVDEKSGVTCKARLDIYSGSLIADLKKTRDLDAFHWQLRDLHYNIQSGHYTNGAIACGLPVTDFAFIPCEAVSPWRVAFGIRKQERLQEDMIEAQRLIGLVVESQVSGEWPNYAIPPWIHSLADITEEDLVVEF